ncbi:MAG: type II secretion system F family protein [Candidatus Omnitrophica bacterium]|nr:type II secretion system F family protein [Candidatus Omnitrophota bacterium]
MGLLISILILGSVVLIAYSLLPQFLNKAKNWQKDEERKVAKEMDNMFYDKSPRKIVLLYFILPEIFGIIAFIIFHSIIVAIGLALVGLTIPNLILKLRFNNRKKKFASQLLDAINLLSSSLKGGLSLLQALEVVVEEMPAPISQEFGLVVRENKMGVLLEDSFRNLNSRMDIEELRLMVSSILVARETGGDLTKVFSRLSTTIRDNFKLKENIKTLTLQGRMQAGIMSVLPFLFVAWVITVNKNHFDIMLNNDLGRMLLIIAVVLQVVGMFLIRKFSIIKL